MAKKWKDEKVNEFLTIVADDLKQDVIFLIKNPGLMRDAKKTLKAPVNERNLINLVERYRNGTTNPGKGTASVPRTCLSELRAKNGRMEVYGIFDKKS